MTNPGWYSDPTRRSDGPVVAAVVVGAMLIVVAMIAGLLITQPWQSPQEKACVAGFQSERARERGVPQSTTREYCRALYG